MTHDIWHHVVIALPPSAGENGHIFVELQPVRGWAEFAGLIADPPLSANVRPHAVHVGPRGLAIELRGASGDEAIAIPPSRYWVRLAYVGERPRPAGRIESVEHFWKPMLGVKHYPRLVARHGVPYPTLREVFDERLQSIEFLAGGSDDQRDHRFFYDYDFETYHADGQPEHWTDIGDPPTKLDATARRARFGAIASLGTLLFGRMKERLQWPHSDLGPLTSDQIDQARLIESLHLKLFARHFGPLFATTAVDTIGRTYGRFANVELLRPSSVAKNGVISNFENGVPNSLYFACIAELADVLAIVGSEKALWKRLSRFAVAGILLLARSMFACHHTVDTYDTSSVHDPLDSTRRDKLLRRFGDFDDCELLLQWARVLRLAAPRSFYGPSSEPTCSAQQKAVELAVSTV